MGKHTWGITDNGNFQIWTPLSTLVLYKILYSATLKLQVQLPLILTKLGFPEASNISHSFLWSSLKQFQVEYSLAAGESWFEAYYETPSFSCENSCEVYSGSVQNRVLSWQVTIILHDINGVFLHWKNMTNSNAFVLQKKNQRH